MQAQTFEERVIKALDTLQTGQEELRGSVRRLEVLYKEAVDKIDHIIEIVPPELQRNTKQDQRLDTHESRITFLERVKT